MISYIDQQVCARLRAVYRIRELIVHSICTIYCHSTKIHYIKLKSVFCSSLSQLTRVPQRTHHQIMTTLVTLSWIYLHWLYKPILLFQPMNIRLDVDQTGCNLCRIYWWCVDCGTRVMFTLRESGKKYGFVENIFPYTLV